MCTHTTLGTYHQPCEMVDIVRQLSKAVIAHVQHGECREEQATVDVIRVETQTRELIISEYKSLQTFQSGVLAVAAKGGRAAT